MFNIKKIIMEKFVLSRLAEKRIRFFRNKSYERMKIAEIKILLCHF